MTACCKFETVCLKTYHQIYMILILANKNKKSKCTSVPYVIIFYDSMMSKTQVDLNQAPNVSKFSNEGPGNESVRIINVMVNRLDLDYESVLPLTFLYDDIIPEDDYLLLGMAEGFLAELKVLHVEVVPSVVSEVRVLLFNNTGENVFRKIPNCSAYLIVSVASCRLRRELLSNSRGMCRI